MGKKLTIFVTIAGIFAAIWAVLRTFGNLRGDGGGVKPVRDGLEKSQGLARDLADEERATGEGLREQAREIESARGSVEDGLGVLEKIRKRGPRK